MDSKMDSGYLGPGENQTQVLEDDYDVTRELSAEEVLGVMDELLCYEVCAPLFLWCICWEWIELDDTYLSWWFRWHGIRDIRFRKRFSRRCILTGYYGRYRGLWKRLDLTVIKVTRKARHWYTLFCARIVLR